MDSSTLISSNIDSESIAIPFIAYTVEDGFRVSEEARSFLGTLKGKLGVVAVCGKYRTGKSYLLNKLFMEPLAQ